MKPFKPIQMKFSYDEVCSRCVDYIRLHPDATFESIVLTWKADGRRHACFGLCQLDTKTTPYEWLDKQE